MVFIHFDKLNVTIIPDRIKMKIEKIELRHIKMELVSPFTTSMGTEYDEEHIIVRVDGEGFTGKPR